MFIWEAGVLCVPPKTKTTDKLMRVKFKKKTEKNRNTFRTKTYTRKFKLCVQTKHIHTQIQRSSEHRHNVFDFSSSCSSPLEFLIFAILAIFRPLPFNVNGVTLSFFVKIVFRKSFTVLFFFSDFVFHSCFCCEPFIFDLNVLFLFRSVWKT